MTTLKQKFRSSRLFALYNLGDSRAKGRLMLLCSTATTNLALVLSTGLFYTGFLINNGINLTNIGIITFIPSIASCFTIFSPMILERIRRRKWLLAGGRFLYYTFYILGVTIVPLVIQDTTLKVVCFVVTVLLGNIINAITSSGYTSWHINFLPDEVRAEHFGINNLVANISAQGFGLLFALVVDSFAGTPNDANILVWLRYAGYAIAMLDVFILTRPDEYPYEKTAERPRFRDIFVKPIRNKRFLATILIIAGWTFFANLPGSVINYYLLEDLHIQYSYIQFINFLYPFFVLGFMGPCRRLLKKLGWLRVFGIGGLIEGVTFVLYGFVTAETYPVLFPLVRLTQHLTGALMTAVSFANLPYMNLPNEDRTEYMSFYILMANAAAFLGLMSGTWFVALLPDAVIQLGGLAITNIQMLLILEGFGLSTVGLITWRRREHIRPLNGAY